ncbi:unnamed protein product [Rotaria magnacalcarata]|uniref:Tripeptidyl peptidase II second Ig-like domain-containing protein n=1 Tax=Rotaria magnacalcarata TaxID=392030 RepID=A0A816YXM3_9BILA|nr:unnamed protein product [Rotaria magnacalcarata]
MEEKSLKFSPSLNLLQIQTDCVTFFSKRGDNSLLKASEIQVKCPYLYELLYDNEYDAALWMCFDTNKQYLGAGDVMKDYSLKLEKGDFVIRIQIRHDKYDLLERFLKDNGGTGLTLHIEHRVT